MSEEERKLKAKVDEYFKKYWSVSFEKFIENWEETSEALEYKDKEIERLKKIPSIEDLMKISDEKFDELTKIAIKETINEELNKKIKELQERIDKAIEYIENNVLTYIDEDGLESITDKEENELIKILRGDKE